jgi:hypothetical protein
LTLIVFFGIRQKCFSSLCYLRIFVVEMQIYDKE